MEIIEEIAYELEDGLVQIIQYNEQREKIQNKKKIKLFSGAHKTR